MARITNYPVAGVLDDSFSVILDSLTEGTRSIPVADFLTELFGSSDVALPNNTMIFRPNSDLEGAQGISDANLAVPMSVYYIGSASTAATIINLPIAAAGLLITLGLSGRWIQLYVRFMSGSKAPTIYFRSCRQPSSETVTEWETILYAEYDNIQKQNGYSNQDIITRYINNYTTAGSNNDVFYGDLISTGAVAKTGYTAAQLQSNTKALNSLRTKAATYYGKWSVWDCLNPESHTLSRPTIVNGHLVPNNSGGYFVSNGICHVAYAFQVGPNHVIANQDNVIATGFPNASNAYYRGAPVTVFTGGGPFYDGMIDTNGRLILAGDAQLSYLRYVQISGEYIIQ